MSSKKKLVSCTFLMLCIGMVTTCHAQDAQDQKVPTLEEYSAARARLAMAKVEAAIAQAKKGADGQSSTGGASPTNYGSVYPPGAAGAPVTTSSHVTEAEPTVNYTSANAKGTMVAELLLSDGNTTTVWAGKSLGHGMTVQSITVNDVLVRDAGGIHPLDWTGAQGSSRAPSTTVPSAPYGTVYQPMTVPHG